MYYALLVSNRQRVYHAQHVSPAPTTLLKPTPAASAIKQLVSRLITRLQNN